MVQQIDQVHRMPALRGDGSLQMKGDTVAHPAIPDTGGE
jgi:hypothetical protein